jgi:hypothetical protein
VTLESMISGMSHDEKLDAMELFWRELSRGPDAIPSPEWHGRILAERMAAVREGHTRFVDWSAAKKRLRDRLE